jgi:hypothetical protein
MALLAATTVTPALAQTPAKPATAADDDRSADAERAAELFTQGKAAARKSDWQNAYRLFQESWILNASFDVAANLGFSALKLKRHADAARYLSYALRHFPTTGERTKRTELSRLLGVAKKQVTTVTVVVEPASAEILINDTPRTEPGAPLFLDPGQHTIEARASGYESEKQTLTTTAGAERNLNIALKQSLAPAALTAPPPAAPAPSAPPPTTERTPTPNADSADSADSGRSLVPAIVAGGIAVVGLAAGIGFTLSANSKESEAEDIRKTTGGSGCAPPASSPDCDRLSDLEKSEDRQSTFGTLGFVVGGVAAATALGYLLWPDSGPATAATRTRARHFAATPAVGPTGAALFVSTSF